MLIQRYASIGPAHADGLDWLKWFASITVQLQRYCSSIPVASGPF
ncbi:hypothetical protein [Paraburkholderia oxyphila]|nr:hypothetical protein [Paraburkholderia oxyphila]